MHLITLFRIMNPHQRCLQAKVKYRNEPKQVMPKSEDLSRSLEIYAIWTFDTEFPTIFNKTCTYITFKSAVKHRQLGYGYPRGQTVHLAEATTQDTYSRYKGYPTLALSPSYHDIKILYRIHVFIGHGAQNIIIYNIASHDFQFPFTFQDITLVCWNMCI